MAVWHRAIEFEMFERPGVQPNVTWILRWRHSTPFDHDGFYNLAGQFRLLRQCFLRRVFALADQFAIELQPGPFLVHHARLDTDIQNAAFLVDAMIVNNIELGLGKGRSDLVLHNLHLDVIANGVAGGVLERILAANVNADAGVEFQCLAARSGFGITEHHADFLAHLIGKDAGSLGFGKNGGELAQECADPDAHFVLLLAVGQQPHRLNEREQG